MLRTKTVCVSCADIFSVEDEKKDRKPRGLGEDGGGEKKQRVPEDRGLINIINVNARIMHLR